MRDQRRREAGFTLIEVLVVLGLIVIMAGVSLPAVARYLKNYQIKSAQQMVAGEINTARTKAIMKNVNFGVVFVVLDNKHFRYVVEDMPQVHTRCRAGESTTAPCLSNRMTDTGVEAGQAGPIRTLPSDIVFGSGCTVTDSGVTMTMPATGDAKLDSGFRFDHLGTWCDPGNIPIQSATQTALSEPCPLLGTGLATGVYNNIQAGGFGAMMCLVQPSTGLKRSVIVGTGGRVKQPAF